MTNNETNTIATKFHLTPMKRILLNTKVQRILTLLALTTSFNVLQAQVMEIIDATTPPITPEALISNIFLGDGVEVLDVQYQGDPLAVGYFNNGDGAVGINRGIVMTSGRAASVNCGSGPLGADCNGTQFSSTDNASNANDPDLSSIAAGGLGVFDVAKFTITFIPTSDTLRFKYVFASEEYPEYACSPFNDVFGFFISGPGLNGPYQNNGINIALIPNTTTPVTINNIHPANGAGCPPVFAQYYNNNMNNNGQPVYDGYLDVFTAEVVVIPCETYVIKLAISDVGDPVFDTGVFLEAKSFGTGSLKVETATVSLDGTITEDCASGTITFSYPGPVEDDFLLDYTIIGTAQNGVDYLPIPPDLTIPAGDSTISVDIIAFEDGIPEGMESIGIDIQRDVCNRDTFWIFVRDNEIVPPNLGPDTSICADDSLILDGTLPIPLPVPPSFTNSQDYVITNTAPVYSPIIVAGVQPVTLGPGVIQSVCLNIDHNWVDDVDVFLISPAGQFMQLSSDNGSNCDDYTNVCFTPSATNNIGNGFPWPPCSSGGQPSFANGTFAPEGVWSDLWDGDYPTNGTWQLLVIDDQQGFNGTLLDWTITFEPLYQIDYEWTPTEGLSCTDCPIPTATPEQTTTYTVTATDTYGCTVQDSITITVNNNFPAPVVNCSDVTNNSITFTWDPIPGASDYMVSINGAPATLNNTTTEVVSGLTLGTSVFILVSAVGECSSPPGMAICSTPACTAPSLSVMSQTNLSCPGETNGAVTLEGSGGAGDYSYTLNGVTNTTGIFTGLPEGNYPATVIDSWNCPNTIQITITAPPPLAVLPTIVNPVSCNEIGDAVVAAPVTGGVQPYSFSWSNNLTDSLIINQSAGSLTVTVTDANGCSATSSVDLTEPALLSLNTAVDSADCNGTATGGALVLAAGGVAPYSIQWDAAAGNATTDLVNNLPAGNYTVTVTDDNACTVTATATILEPAALVGNIPSFTDPFCNGDDSGTATVTATGGVGGYEYFWSNGDFGPSADSLLAGLVSVTISDANSCTASVSATLTDPPGMSLQLTPTHATCFGLSDGSIATTLSGGTLPYTYLWSENSSADVLSNIAADTYCLTVTDGMGCTITACSTVTQPDALQINSSATDVLCNGGNTGAVDLTVTGGTGTYTFDWASSQTSEDISNLTIGNYLVTVTDANNCTATAAETVNEPQALAAQLTPTAVACSGGNDGSIQLAASGGVGNYSYQWTGPNGFVFNGQNPSGLVAGNYTVTIEDGNNCSITQSISVSQPATAVAVNIAQPAMICFGANNGTATATASGGVGPYTYAWSNNQSGATANGLTAGSYTVVATDANLCTASTTVTIQQQAPIVVNLSQTPPDCFNGSNGAAAVTTVTQGGNNLPLNGLTIQWSNAQSGGNASGLLGGQAYTVTVTNALGCTGTASITIGNPSAVAATITNELDVNCAGGRDGAATVLATGGSSPYTYLWSANAESQVTPTATNLPAGNFSVTVSDGNGCTAIAQANLEEPDALVVNFENQRIDCFGYATGATEAQPEGGVSPYSFLWSTGKTDQKLTDLVAGLYQVTITDGNGCTFVAETEVVQPSEGLTATAEVEDVTCFGRKDGRITTLPTGGTPPYRYSLNGEDFILNSVFIALPAGDYDLVVQDANGCEWQVDPIVINEPGKLSVDLGPDTLLLYNSTLLLDPVIENLTDPGTATYFWESNNPQLEPKNPTSLQGEFLVVSAATVFFTVTDENGCEAEDHINIFVEAVREILVPTGFSPGNGGNPVNDLLHVHGNSQMVKEIKLFRIFDRWGELLYEDGGFGINDLNVGWDGSFKGKDMPSGVYVWQVEVEYVDGLTESHKGETTLVR